MKLQNLFQTLFEKTESAICIKGDFLWGHKISNTEDYKYSEPERRSFMKFRITSCYGLISCVVVMVLFVSVRNVSATIIAYPAPPGLTTSPDFTVKVNDTPIWVELAFEDHRFRDIRRWKTGPSTINIYGVNITKDALGVLTFTPKTG